MGQVGAEKREDIWGWLGAERSCKEENPECVAVAKKEELAAVTSVWRWFH